MPDQKNLKKSLLTLKDLAKWGRLRHGKEYRRTNTSNHRVHTTPDDYPDAIEPSVDIRRDFYGSQRIRLRRQGEPYPCSYELGIWMKKATGNWWYIQNCSKCGHNHELLKGYKDQHHFEFIICPVKLRKLYRFYAFDRFKTVDKDEQ